MLLDVGVVFATYMGIKLYKKYRKNKKCPKDKMIVERVKLQGNLKETVVNEAKGASSHDLKVSVISMGLGAIRQVIYYPPIAILSLAVFIYTAIPYLERVENSWFQKRKFDGYVLFFIGDTIVLAMSQYFAVAFAVWLGNFGKYVTEKAKDHSQKMLINVFEQQPRNVWILKDNVEIEVPLETVKLNDIVVVNTGEVIPIDGIITEGVASIDQHALTGESQPAEKEVGAPVFASTIIITGRIFVKVKKSGQDTTIAKIGSILNHSIDFKSSVQLKGEEWADQMTLPMLGIAGLGFLTLGPMGATVVINGHIANRIRILAPLVTLNHLKLAAHKGILIKDGRAIEELIKVDTILFDKTGTLTEEVPEVGRIIVCENYEENEILRYAVAAERKLVHPIAKAILNKAKKAKLVLPEIEDSKYQIGYGIKVSFENKIIRVGSIRFMKMEDVAIPKKIEEAMAAHTEGHSFVMVGINDKVGGAIEIQPSIRPEVKSIISGLRQRGIKHIAIVSGDHKHPTQKLANSLGMDSYFYDILPEEKADIVEQLQKEGKSVCFVGDGINDAIAMKKAQVSISLRGASTLATDLAQVVFMDGTLSHLCDLFDISKSVEVNLQKSLIMTLSPTVINVGGAFLLNLGFVTSLIINQVVVFVGVGNAMLTSRQIVHRKIKDTSQCQTEKSN